MVGEPELDDIIEKMEELFEAYERYDTTRDILAGWKYHVSNRYPEAQIGLLGDLGRLDGKGRFHREESPDFLLAFPANRYGVIGEVKASLSTGDDSLASLADQLSRYDGCDYAFRLRRGHEGVEEPTTQDILLILPAESGNAVGLVLADGTADLPPPCVHKNVCLCGFTSDDTPPARNLSFFRFRWEGKDALRDAFLAPERRLSHYLGTDRIELHSKDFQHLRDFIVAGTDQNTSNLGIFSVILMLVQRFWGGRGDLGSYSDKKVPKTISFSVEQLLQRLRRPPYVCSLRQREVMRIMTYFGESSGCIEVDREAGHIVYEPPRVLRYGSYKTAEVLQHIAPRHKRGRRMPFYCFHLARGELMTQEKPGEQAERAERDGETSGPGGRVGEPQGRYDVEHQTSLFSKPGDEGRK